MRRILSDAGFDIYHNVELTVIDNMGRIKKTITKHNKASRNMVTGILRYLCGHFTKTDLNSEIQYADDAKRYIPCYFNVGDGNVVLETDPNTGQSYPVASESGNEIPAIDDPDWRININYSDTHLQREFFVIDGQPPTGSRFKIRLQDNTLHNSPVSDTDSIYFYCEVPPSALNAFYNYKPVYATELGLFSSEIPGTEDLLASVRLANYTVEEEGQEVEKTDALYIQTDDTLAVKWIITIAAIGIDGMFVQDYKNAENDVEVLPTIGEVPIIVVPDAQQPSEESND